MTMRHDDWPQRLSALQKTTRGNLHYCPAHDLLYLDAQRCLHGSAVAPRLADKASYCRDILGHIHSSDLEKRDAFR